ncbi:protocatechuate 3,4-dioxygenase beta subunit [Nonomuraea polychroma]|uniref:Protocatechuate 3,4-dioxygenase beta subunit n=1 Tax=Nonomuraea polychroma TaxID=46176 RepID=A0A438LXV9_9ACTN|nr:intradiol ring-cleavage dioxygenase [Nonomuraea polychroma]RVX38346.1 protocatechuate 3,4-dioxygenase beta subunit [Nonomuraea polychroma]
MGHDHEGQRVSRRRLISGISSLGLGGLLAACGSGADTSTGATAVTTSTGATVTPEATTTSDLTSLFTDASTCKLTQTTTQGPYYFDADKIRGDIREDKQGVRLRVAIKVQDSETCKPLPNAVVEIWHCDAAGLYSGAEAQSTGTGGGNGTPPSGAPTGAPPSAGTGGGGEGDMADLTPTDDKRYLRGAQVTNSDGIVEFTTIWPGWYRGRTIHIHAMVHFSSERVLTTQMMFDEKLNSTVMAMSPYSEHTGRDTFNDNDNIYDDSMLMKVTKEDDGYLGVIVFAADSDKDGS